MTSKEKYISLLKGTQRPGIDRVIDYLLNSDFFTATPHRHHLYRGGLCDHSLQAYDQAKAKYGSQIADDSLVIATLLHDVCSAHHPAAARIHGHGRKSVAILRNICVLELKPEEAQAIFHHMHHLDRAKNYPAIVWAVKYGDRQSCIYDFFSKR